MSDELIAAFDIRGTEATGLTIECAWNVGKALADWLPTSGTVLVTTVPSQQAIAGAVIEGLRLQGRNVIDGGGRDKTTVVEHVVTAGLSGAVVVGWDELEQMITIELYREDGKLVDSASGLQDIRAVVQAGNLVPAAVKGELTALA